MHKVKEGLKAYIVAKVTSTGELNIIPCGEDPTRTCFEIGDYLPDKDIGNIFEKFKDSKKLEEYLRGYTFRAVKRPGMAIRYFKLLLEMTKDPCNYLLVTKECTVRRRKGKEKECWLEVYQPTSYYEYEALGKTPEERQKLRENNEAAELFRIGLNYIGTVRIDPEQADRLPVPRQPLQEIHDPDLRRYIVEQYIELLKAKALG